MSFEPEICLGVGSSSKKICKPRIYPSKSKRSKSKNYLQSLSKYETFNAQEKSIILQDVWQGIAKVCNLKIDENEEPLAQDLIRTVEAIDLKIYNKIIIQVLEKYVPSFSPQSSARILSQWRKKIKSWAYNSGKPENRGNPLVPLDKVDLFRSLLKKILSTLEFRHFSELRQKVLVVVQDFSKQGFYGSKVSVKKSCSKHWWFDYLHKNPDIKEMWEKIPLERGLRRFRSIPLIVEEGGKLESKERRDTLHMTDPIFSSHGFDITFTDDSTTKTESSIIKAYLCSNGPQIVPNCFSKAKNIEKASELLDSRNLLKQEFKVENCSFIEKMEELNYSDSFETKLEKQSDVKSEYDELKCEDEDQIRGAKYEDI